MLALIHFMSGRTVLSEMLSQIARRRLPIRMRIIMIRTMPSFRQAC